MYIGIDLGTSSLKLAIVSESGKLIKVITKEYNIYQPKDLWSEQDPLEWKKAMESAFVDIKEYSKQIKALSFSGQMHGLVLLDENDHVIRNAILWNDHRTFLEVEELNNNLGANKIFDETSNFMLTGVTAPKLLWVKNKEPFNFSRIKKIMLPKDYLVFLLTNQYVTDVSDASGTLYYDVKNRRYSKYILDYLIVSKEMLPKVLNSSDVVGLLSKSYCDKYGFREGTKVVVGGADQAVGAIANNTLKPGQWSISIGTSGVVYTPVDEIKFESSKFHAFASATNTYYYMGVTLSAANSLSWIKNILYEDKSYDEVFENLDINLQNNIVFLPYLNGERAPINDPFAQGTFIGMHNKDSKEDIFKSVLEGVAFSFKQIVSEFEKDNPNPINKIKVIGGGARNDKWVQIIADVLNKQIETIKNNYGPSYGAALLAIQGYNNLDSLEEIANYNIEVLKVYEPNLDNYNYYNNKYLKYNSLYGFLKPYWHK